MYNESIIGEKSKLFAVRIVKLYKYLCDKNEFVISKQILRSGTSIGANVTEGRYAQSKLDFISNVSSITAFWQLLAENLQNRFSDVVYMRLRCI